MADYERPKAVYEPGELDRTRANLGLIDAEEAKRMMKTLGGTVGIEKSRPLDEKAIPVKHSSNRVVNGKISDTPGGGGRSGRPTSSEIASQAAGFAAASKPTGPKLTLPSVPAKTKQIMDDLLIEFGIKPKPVFLAALFKSLRSDKVSPTFISTQLPGHIKNMEIFSSSLKAMVALTHPSFQEQLKTGTTAYLKTINVVCSWDISGIKKHLDVLSEDDANQSIAQLIPITREIYTCLYKVYFLGEKRVKDVIQRLAMEASKTYPDKAEKMQLVARAAASAWLYLYENTLSRLYPLLLRMTCNDITVYPDIMKVESQRILTFLGITKFELVFPDKEPEVSEVEVQEKKEEAKKAQQKQASREQVVKGLKILDALFPQAGFNIIHQMPDMFPYFQPLYQFPDGFNYLNSENPLQVTIVLLRIIEDFFMGFRNVNFLPDDEVTEILGEDTLSHILSEWVEYREVLFEKNYCSILREYVGNLTASMEYASSALAKKTTSNLLWYARNQFLAGLQFDLRFLDRPEPDKLVPPLGPRVAKLKTAFDYILGKCVLAYKENPKEATQRTDLGVEHVFSQYSFPVPNVISRRLDVLLGGKNSKNANIFNLIKYTNYVITVLDWWINDSDSPAYAVDAEQIYRKDNGGKPIFSIPTRGDQNEVFAQSIKRAAAAKAGAAGAASQQK